MTERKPAQVIPNPRDEERRKTDQVKSAWRKATHVKREVQREGEEQPKARRVRLEGSMGLKEFARRQAGEAGKRWLHNKRANTSNPPLGIGRTRKKKGAGSGPKNPSGK